MSVGTYYYYSKLDKSTEAVDKVFTTGRLSAAKHFANRKNLPPKEKEGADSAAQQDLDQWLKDLDKELDTLEEEQKERWGPDGKPEE